MCSLEGLRGCDVIDGSDGGTQHGDDLGQLFIPGLRLSGADE
jgi:hypothetical protein